MSRVVIRHGAEEGDPFHSPDNRWRSKRTEGVSRHQDDDGRRRSDRPASHRSSVPASSLQTFVFSPSTINNTIRGQAGIPRCIEGLVLAPRYPDSPTRPYRFALFACGTVKLTEGGHAWAVKGGTELQRRPLDWKRSREAATPLSHAIFISERMDEW